VLPAALSEGVEDLEEECLAWKTSNVAAVKDARLDEVEIDPRNLVQPACLRGRHRL
jgi:hypothetical protein